MTRTPHLVGTIPADDAATALDLQFEHLGDRLLIATDGQTGKLQHWIRDPLLDLENHPDLYVVKQGGWEDYGDQSVHAVKRRNKLRADSLDLLIWRSYEENREVFEEKKRQHGCPNVVRMVGVPAPLDWGLFAFNPLEIPEAKRSVRVRNWVRVLSELRGSGPFTAATLREMTRVHSHARGEVVFQIEVPVELGLVTTPIPDRDPERPPRRQSEKLQRFAAHLLAGAIARLARRAPEGARFGVHLCVGDLGHRALTKLPDASPIALLARAIAARWPRGRPLEFVHAPFAAGEDPPATDRGWYRPLLGLRAMEGVRFIAGLAHEGQDPHTQRELLAVVDDLLGRPVDVGPACGLGRRTPEKAVLAIQRTRELSEA